MVQHIAMCVRELVITSLVCVLLGTGLFLEGVLLDGV